MLSISLSAMNKVVPVTGVSTQILNGNERLWKWKTVRNELNNKPS